MNLEKEMTDSLKENSQFDNKELPMQLEKQVAVSIWIQSIGKIMESVNLTKILLLSEEKRFETNELQIVQGVWIQTIGQIIEALGVTKEVLSGEENDLKWTAIANSGDWLQGIGAIYEAHAGKQIIQKEKAERIAKLFIP